MTSVFNVFDYVMENDVNLLKICVDMENDVIGQILVFWLDHVRRP